ncbi:hypothetical protein BXU09_17520 [Deinococcus sp. LM3]|nr:hypothetical protein BXU09_17520 [Deinococcus sp. LM3]
MAQLFLEVWHEMWNEKNTIELYATTWMHCEVWRSVMIGEFRQYCYESARKGVRVREKVDQTNRRQDACDRQAGVRSIRRVVQSVVGVRKMRTREEDDV